MSIFCTNVTVDGAVNVYIEAMDVKTCGLFP